ncbi:40S ribosomal protein S21-like [Zingiber officinale]|uniref:40S ribosomal protein S21-like n=1 Tax=Zingiber officinale TaxID=94328 RepID=UPI001C4CA907|nr:40S ribosomal protein S21-like [Zingiber officinale]
MQNVAGEMMNLYIPRKCSATNRLITAKDHASVQINIGHLDDNGVYTGQYTTFALSGFIRAQVCSIFELKIMEESETSKENAERPPRVDHWAEKGSIPWHESQYPCQFLFNYLLLKELDAP